VSTAYGIPNKPEFNRLLADYILLGLELLGNKTGMFRVISIVVTSGKSKGSAPAFVRVSPGWENSPLS